MRQSLHCPTYRDDPFMEYVNVNSPVEMLVFAGEHTLRLQLVSGTKGIGQLYLHVPPGATLVKKDSL